jgi:hypothetical protein
MSPISRCHPIAIRWQRTGCLASPRSAPLMLGSAHGAMRLPPRLVGMDLRRRYRVPRCKVNAPHLLCLWTASPGARALSAPFSSMIGLPTCLKSSCLKRGVQTKGRDLRLKVRRIRSGASRDRHGDVVRLNFMAPHCGNLPSES